VSGCRSRDMGAIISARPGLANQDARLVPEPQTKANCAYVCATTPLPNPIPQNTTGVPLQCECKNEGCTGSQKAATCALPAAGFLINPLRNLRLVRIFLPTGWQSCYVLLYIGTFDAILSKGMWRDFTCLA